MVVHAEFVKNEYIPVGQSVAKKDEAVVWIGPLALCPLDHLPVGTKLYVNPVDYDRIESAVSKVEKGVPRGDQ